MSTLAVASPLSAAERITELLARVEYRRADTDEDREAIFRLRYQAYVREGAIRPSFGESFSDGFDDLDNTWIIGVFIDDRLVSSMRLHVANRDFPDTVATRTFPEFVVPMIKSGATIVDPTRFVVDDAAARVHPDLHFATVRIGHMAAEHFDADFVLAAVRREHQAFYKRIFGHQPVCDPRPYPTLVKPLGLMSLHYPTERERILRRFPFFQSTEAERSAVFGAPLIPSRPGLDIDALVPAMAG